MYTRNGAFSIDDEGYLALLEVGRVMGTNGPIYLGTDDIEINNSGTVYFSDGRIAGNISVVDFADKTQLEKAENGIFTTNAQGNNTNAKMIQGYIEQSNVNSVDEMVSMMESQRALQSAAQVLKIYDQLMSKAVNNIGQI